MKSGEADAGGTGAGSDRPRIILPEWPVVFDQGVCEVPLDFDAAWARGWRHFGSRFFRYSLMMKDEAVLRVQCARLDLERFVMTKSQRRTWRNNDDTRLQIAPPTPDDREEIIFLKHRDRFSDNVPEALTDFLGPEGTAAPCPCVQLSVYVGDALVAASFLGVGQTSCSSIYAIFDPAHERRRLGIYTALQEIELARRIGLRYYYLGYITVEPSCYDYKKQFSGLEIFSWEGDWVAAPP